MIQKILSTKNIELAKEHLLQKKDTSGVDGMRISELPEYLKLNRNSLIKTILDGKYNPNLVQQIDFLNKKGKLRTISMLTTLDRLILRAVSQVIYDKVSPQFSPYSFAYQSNRSVIDAVRQTADYAEQGYTFVVEIDIDSYFDNITHYKMIELLKEYEIDEITLDLIKRFLTCSVVRDFEVHTMKKGLIQGSPLSPLLSNIYLHELDQQLEECDIPFCRFADDIKIFAKTFEKGLEVFSKTKKFLESERLLTLHSQKSGVFNIFDRVILGYQLSKFGNGKVEIRKKTRNEKFNIYEWKSTAIQRINADYHLIADGILSRKDYNLLFENPEKKMYFPVECTDTVSIYSNISFSPDFFWFASERGFLVNLFNKYGEYMGAFVPKQQLEASPKVFMKQVLAYEDAVHRLILAKQFSISAAHNIRENLKYYAKHNNRIIFKEVIEEITAAMDEEKNASDIGKLMLIEARIRERYYACLNDILPYDDFTFTKRSRRPPEDPLNSLISFGNTLLYRRIAKEIYKSRLDIRIGYLHSTNQRPESLNLDIAEIFRPVIVEKVIFSLINRHMLNEQLHFDILDTRAVYLNKAGKKIFIKEFEAKMHTQLTLNGRSVSYGELIKNEIYKLIRHFEKGEPYKAYKYFL